MTSPSSTFRSAADATIGGLRRDNLQRDLRQQVAEEWMQADRADLFSAIQRHPQLLRHRSVLLDLAIDEYKSFRRDNERVELESHCRRFRVYGSSVERSIFRQLETQQFLDEHPELLEFLSQPKWPQIGEEFAGFVFLEELGSGALARVYLCRQGDVGNRRVVLKVTPFSGFEASILGRLNHPGIIPIHSTGSFDDGRLQYLCMPYAGRSTLADLLDVAFQHGLPRSDRVVFESANRWTSTTDLLDAGGRSWLLGNLVSRTYVDGIVYLAKQIAAALEHAHEQRILHGDLKPSNVLLTSAGQPLLLDFNLSRDSENPLGHGGGTLPYMPPEHLRRIVHPSVSHHQENILDVRTDIYSFGALLYELLTGSPPAVTPRRQVDPAAAAEDLLAQMSRGIPSLRRRNPLVSKRLEKLVLHCLHGEAAQRPQSMGQVRRALETESRPAAEAFRQAFSHPYWCAGVVTLLTSVVMCMATYFALRPPRHEEYLNYGIQAIQSGETQQAADYFDASLAADPTYPPARFARGRLRMVEGQLDLAISDFFWLAREVKDARAMAYLGYCFNLKSFHDAALVWYERLDRNDADTLAVQNNLGATYLLAHTRIPNQERIERAELHLRRASELDGTSDAVRLNLLQLEIQKSQSSQQHNPSHAHARTAHVRSSPSSADRDFLFRYFIEPAELHHP